MIKNIELEQSVLKLMIDNIDVYSYVKNHLKRKYFSSKEYKNIFSFFIKYYLKFGDIATPKVFLNEVRGKNHKVFDKYQRIINAIMKRNASKNELKYYIDEILTSYKARKTLKIIFDATNLIHSGKTQLAIEQVQNSVMDLKREGDIEIIREGSYIDNVQKRGKELLTKEYYFGNHVGVPTGLTTFDKYFDGVFPEELGIIFGGTGKGKSIMLLNLAVNALKLDLPVVIVTLEMSKMQYEYRLDSRLTGISSNKFRKKELTREDMRLWIDTMKTWKHKNNLYIIDIPEGANTNLIEMKLTDATRYLKSNKFLLIVDYLNLLLPNRNIKTSTMDWQVQGEVAHDLKILARKLHVPIWTAAQLSSKKANKTILTPEDSGYAYKISQEADFALGLVQTPDMKEEGIMHIVCMKGREGQISTIECYPNFDKMLIHEKGYDENEQKPDIFKGL